MDLWSLYMARATAGAPVLDFPEADESDLKYLNRGYARDPYGYYPDSAAPPSSN
jgi:hypothetical protein